MQETDGEDRKRVPGQKPGATELGLALPLVIDREVVVLLDLLLPDQQSPPLVLDASATQLICPIAALQLASALRRRQELGIRVRIARLRYDLRKQIERHPLAAFVVDEGPRPDPPGRPAWYPGRAGSGVWLASRVLASRRPPADREQSAAGSPVAPGGAPAIRQARRLSR